MCILPWEGHGQFVQMYEAGNMPPEVTVMQGQAQVKFPVPRPVGFSRLLPDLMIEYDSGVGNGPLGLGWDLSGLSQISRYVNLI